MNDQFSIVVEGSLALLLLAVVAASLAINFRRARARRRRQAARAVGQPRRATEGLLDQVKALILGVQSAAVDPARFNDPLAVRSGWTPASRGGTNITTHRLADGQGGRLEFRPTWTLRLMAALLALIGGALLAMVARTPGAVSLSSPDLLWPGLAGLLFLTLGIRMSRIWGRPRVFDRASGRFWIGREAPLDGGGRQPRKSCRLDEIRALQILPEQVRGNRSRYWSYELNLVLRDATRICVVDHGDIGQLRADAERLAAALGCRIWDAAAPEH